MKLVREKRESALADVRLPQRDSLPHQGSAGQARSHHPRIQQDLRVSPLAPCTCRPENYEIREGQRDSNSNLSVSSRNLTAGGVVRPGYGRLDWIARSALFVQPLGEEGGDLGTSESQGAASRRPHRQQDTVLPRRPAPRRNDRQDRRHPAALRSQAVSLTRICLSISGLSSDTKWERVE